jgi:hypothetical protein
MSVTCKQYSDNDIYSRPISATWAFRANAVARYYSLNLILLLYLVSWIYTRRGSHAASKLGFLWLWSMITAFKDVRELVISESPLFSRLN